MPRTSSRSGRRPLRCAPTSSKASPGLCGDNDIPTLGRPGSSAILNCSVAASSIDRTRRLEPNDSTRGSPAKICHAEPLGQPAEANLNEAAIGDSFENRHRREHQTFRHCLDRTIRSIVPVAKGAELVAKLVQRYRRAITLRQEDTVDQTDGARMHELK